MARSIRIIALLLLSFGLRADLDAQDLIITTKDDSIRCAITDVGNSMIYYQTIDPDGRHDHHISIEDVAMYSRAGSFPVFLNALGNDRDLMASRRVKRNTNMNGRSPWSLSLTTGLSRMTGRYPTGLTSAYQDYLDRLAHGFHVDAELQYEPTEHVGIGVEYEGAFAFHSSMPLVVTFSDGSTSTINFSEEITMRFIGASVFGVIGKPGGKSSVHLGMSIGRLDFYDNIDLILFAKATGSTVATKLNSSLDLRLSSKLFLVLSLSYLGGSIDQYEFDTGSGPQAHTATKASEKQDAPHINAGVGLRLRF